ncbi:hypothetical protein ACFLU1_06725 [Chloroflexota bacterium]
MIKTGKVDDNKQLFFTLSMGYVLTTLIIAYFHFFPTLGNPVFSDILIVLGLLLLLSCLIYASVKAKSSRDVILVLLGIMLLSILARSVPNLRLAYPPQADAYYYAISTLNIIDYGTLQPVLADWYGGVGAHLHWPMMHLFTAGAVKITGIDSMWFFRFQEPLLGGLFALIAFALAREATKNNAIALLSALFASASDVAIYYQSEYHPQGFAVILFVFFLYIYLKSRTTGRLSYSVLAIVVLAGLLLSHHFSSLFLALLSISFIGFNHLISVLPRRIGRITQVAIEVRADYSLWIIIAVAGLAYHFMAYTGVVQSFFGRITGTQLEPSGELLAIGAAVPLLTTLLNLTKYGIFLLATFSFIRVIRNPRPHEFRLLVLLVCVLFAGFTATFILWGPVDRMILFYAPLVSIFAATTVHKLLTLSRVSLRRTQMIKVTTVLMVGILLVAGFFNGFSARQLYFKSSQVQNYVLPNIVEYKVAGEWTGIHISSDSRIGAGYYSRTFPFFFGKRSFNKVIFPVYSPTASVDYFISEPSVTSGEMPEYDRELSVIYDNGEVEIYKTEIVE